MAFCMLSYQKTPSNGAYLAHPLLSSAGQSTAAGASSPTSESAVAALQAEMRLLTTKDHPHYASSSCSSIASSSSSTSISPGSPPARLNSGRMRKAYSGRSNKQSNKNTQESSQTLLARKTPSALQPCELPIENRLNSDNSSVESCDDQSTSARLQEPDERFSKRKDVSSRHSVNLSSADRNTQILSYDQVLRLHEVMEQVVPIHGRGNFPTLDIKLKTLVKVVRTKLEQAQPPVLVRDIRLNGGAASHVIAPETGGYNDLDLIFAVDLSDTSAYDRVRSAVLDSLLEFLPTGVNRTRLSSASLKEAYIHKMVKVAETDRWSLISLSNNRGRNVELKFVDRMKRQYEFSVDSFHIVLDSLMLFYDCSQKPISANIYPTVTGESVYGDFAEALEHLQRKLIATRDPEQIRGGGLLKYCNLLIRGYSPAEPAHIKSLERYMCSRFFIDFNDINAQRSKLESYLANHFIGDDAARTQYLMQLHQVVDQSTVCLMSYERRQTLCLIEELAMNVYLQMRQTQSVQANANGSLTSTAHQAAAAAVAANFAHYKHALFHQHMHLHPHVHQHVHDMLHYDSMRSQNCALDTNGRLSTRCGSPASNADAHSEASSSTSECSSGGSCNCNTSAPHQQYHAYLLGNGNHYYYAPYQQNNYSHNCFNSCHCGGWMTCA